MSKPDSSSPESSEDTEGPQAKPKGLRGLRQWLLELVGHLASSVLSGF